MTAANHVHDACDTEAKIIRFWYLKKKVIQMFGHIHCLVLEITSKFYKQNYINVQITTNKQKIYEKKKVSSA